MGYPTDKGFDPFRLGLLQACEEEHQRRIGVSVAANEKSIQAMYVVNQ